MRRVPEAVNRNNDLTVGIGDNDQLSQTEMGRSLALDESKTT